MEHKVWSVLDKTKFANELMPQIEYMYDFIEGLVNTSGNCTSSLSGDTVSTMKEFFDLWNSYSNETFKILSSIVNTKQ